MGTVLTFQNVTGKGRRFHLHDINMELEPGFIYSLIGKNGAGKTTLMKYILEENSRYDGVILVNGTDIRMNHVNAMKDIGFISDEHEFFGNRTGKQNVELLGRFYDNFDMERFEQGMKKMGVSPHTTYKSLSRGEKMKFQIAFAMAYSPSIYLMDEVTAGMDPVFKIEYFDMLRNLIRDESCSVLMTTHILSEVERQTDYVAVMEDGHMGEFEESADCMNKRMDEGKYCMDKAIVMGE